MSRTAIIDHHQSVLLCLEDWQENGFISLLNWITVTALRNFKDCAGHIYLVGIIIHHFINIYKYYLLFFLRCHYVFWLNAINLHSFIHVKYEEERKVKNSTLFICYYSIWGSYGNENCGNFQRLGVQVNFRSFLNPARCWVW